MQNDKTTSPAPSLDTATAPLHIPSHQPPRDATAPDRAGVRAANPEVPRAANDPTDGRGRVAEQDPEREDRVAITSAEPPAPQTPSDPAVNPTPSEVPKPEAAEEFDVTLTVPQALTVFGRYNRRPLSDRRLQEICAAGQIKAKKITTSARTEWLLNEPSLVAFILTRPELNAGEGIAPRVGESQAPRAASVTRSIRDRAANLFQAPTKVVRTEEEAPEEVIGETRTLAEALLENARLFTETQVLKALLEKAEAHAAIRVADITAGFKKTIETLEQQRNFQQEELTGYRKSAVQITDMAQAMTQVFLQISSQKDATRRIDSNEGR